MKLETLAELKDEKNALLTDINATLSKIHVTLQNLNQKMSDKSGSTQDIDKLKDQLFLMKRRFILPGEEKDISRRFVTTVEESVQLIENQNDTSINTQQDTLTY